MGIDWRCGHAPLAPCNNVLGLRSCAGESFVSAGGPHSHRMLVELPAAHGHPIGLAAWVSDVILGDQEFASQPI